MHSARGECVPACAAARPCLRGHLIFGAATHSARWLFALARADAQLLGPIYDAHARKASLRARKPELWYHYALRARGMRHSADSQTFRFYIHWAREVGAHARGILALGFICVEIPLFLLY